VNILIVSDEESPVLWDYYTPGKLAGYDLILSCGDLNAKYLEFLVTMARCPLLYVHGNHDGSYTHQPPEGCDCIDDRLLVYQGLRILGLGGSRKYSNGSHQYTERQMEKRIRKLKRAIQLAGGVDLVVAHAAPRGVGDAEDRTHQGFEAFLPLIKEYNPRYFLHGHVHLNYGTNIPRTGHYGDTEVVNCCGKYVLENVTVPQRKPLNFREKMLCKLFTKNLQIVEF
jgi:Icc-related predicted phosphoesterase